MSHPLDGAFAKLRRAYQHLDELKQHVRALMTPGQLYAYTARLQLQNQRIEHQPIPEHYLQQRGISLGELSEPIRTADDGTSLPVLVREYRVCLDADSRAFEWGIILGEIAHNLRCALDYVVWELSIKHQRVSPPASIPPGKSPWADWRRLQFPITRDDTGWNRAINPTWGVGQLWAIDQNLLADFKRLQPYDGGKNPDAEPLWLLQELWNGDKHRTIAIAASVVQTRGLETTSLSRLPEFVSGHVLSWSAPVPFEDGAEIARLELRTISVARAKDQDPTVDMKLNMTLHIAFDKGSLPADTHPLALMLDTCQEVGRILTVFRPLL